MTSANSQERSVTDRDDPPLLWYRTWVTKLELALMYGDTMKPDHEYTPRDFDSDICKCGRTHTWHAFGGWPEESEAEAKRILRVSPASDPMKGIDDFVEKHLRGDPSISPQPKSATVPWDPSKQLGAPSAPSPSPSPVSNPGARSIDWEDEWLEFRSVIRDHRNAHCTPKDVYDWVMRHADNLLDGLEKLKELQNAPPVFVTIDPAIDTSTQEALDYARDKRLEKEICHVLDLGSARCGIKGRPIDWPAGHTWVSMADKHNVTCPNCATSLGICI